MVTPKQLREKTMTPEKKLTDHQNWFSFFMRPVSFVLTAPLLEMKVTANMVSLASVFVSLIGAMLLGLGQTMTVRLVGALFFLLWCVMDHIDGNIARYTGKASPLGAVYDAAGGYAATSLLYFAMGLSVLNTPKGILPWNIPDAWYVAMGGLTAISTIYTRLIMNKKMVMFSAEAAREFKDQDNYSAAKLIAHNLTNPAGLVNIVILLAVIFNCTREFTLIYFLMFVLITVRSMWILLRK